MFLLPVLILAGNSSSLAFLMMCSVHRLNKQGDSRQSCHTAFSILNQSVVPYRVLTFVLICIQVSQETVRLSSIPISLKSFPRFVMIHIVKGLSVADETEIDVFLKFLYFLYNPVNVGNLISSSSTFSKPSLDMWKFLICIILKPEA